MVTPAACASVVGDRRSQLAPADPERITTFSALPVPGSRVTIWPSVKPVGAASKLIVVAAAAMAWLLVAVACESALDAAGPMIVSLPSPPVTETEMVGSFTRCRSMVSSPAPPSATILVTPVNSCALPESRLN